MCVFFSYVVVADVGGGGGGGVFGFILAVVERLKV